MPNENLGAAKKAKNDEFYTQYADIEKEMNAYLEYNPDVFKNKTILLPCDDPEWSNFTKYFAQNFEKFGLKKLISTSYAPNSKPKEIPYQPTLFELESEIFDQEKTVANGKIFTLTQDKTKNGVINFEDLEWNYLQGNGDFRSEEITKLRDEADMIITNPPFSLFREFLAWIIAGRKQFSIIGNMNALTNKGVFPFIISNQMWLGATAFMTDLVFEVPESYSIDPSDKSKAERLGYLGNFTRLGNAVWLTSIEHGKRHQPTPLMSLSDNLRFSRHKEIRAKGYQSYDNYSAIEVPFTDAIPSDYDGAMGVPVSFLDKFNPEQFDLLGVSSNWGMPAELLIPRHKRYDRPYIGGRRMYVRLFIRHRRPS